MTEAIKGYIVGFRYPERLQPIPQYFINDGGDWAIDDLPSAAHLFKDIDQAHLWIKNLKDARLGAELIKASRPALFKFHLLGYRVPVQRAEPCIRLFFREDVRMDIIEVKEGAEGERKLTILETTPLTWDEWTLEDETKTVHLIEASGRLKEMLVVRMNLHDPRPDGHPPNQVDDLNIFGYVDGDEATVRVEFKDINQSDGARLIERFPLTEQVRHALQVEYAIDVSKIAADSRLKHGLDGRVYNLWTGWVQALVRMTSE